MLFVCVTCVLVVHVPNEINVQPCYWLGLGMWSSGSLSLSLRAGRVFWPSTELMRYSEHKSGEQGISSSSFLTEWKKGGKYFQK